MTETEWQSCENPGPKLEAFRQLLTQRQLRLFSVACCRRIWGLPPDDLCRRAVEVAERFADGLAAEQERADVSQQVGALCDAYYTEDWDWSANTTAFLAWNAAGRALLGNQTPNNSAYAQAALAFAGAEVRAAFTPLPPEKKLTGRPGAGRRKPLEAAVSAATAAEEKRQCQMLRDVAGGTCRSALLTTGSLTRHSDLLRFLAKAAYEDRALPAGTLNPSLLAILADALEEGGAPVELVAHLRSPDPHVRGCHVVDLCLGLS